MRVLLPVFSSSICSDSENMEYLNALSLFPPANPEQRGRRLHFRGMSSTKASRVLDAVVLSRHEYGENSATRLAVSTLCNDRPW